MLLTGANGYIGMRLRPVRVLLAAGHQVHGLARDPQRFSVVERLWRIGGANGGGHARWLWWLRGLHNRMVGGTIRPRGLAGRTHWLLVTPLRALWVGGLLRGDRPCAPSRAHGRGSRRAQLAAAAGNRLTCHDGFGRPYASRQHHQPCVELGVEWACTVLRLSGMPNLSGGEHEVSWRDF